MRTHILRIHRGMYQHYFGVPPPDLAPCPEQGCTFVFPTVGEIPDHKLAVHGIENQAHMRFPNKVQRINLTMLYAKYGVEAGSQNRIKQRIRQLEGQITWADPAYRSTHGLNIDDMWSENSVEIRPPPGSAVTEKSHLVNMLCAVRTEADNQGWLQDGSKGSYQRVADDWEAMLTSLTQPVIAQQAQVLSQDDGQQDQSMG